MAQLPPKIPIAVTQDHNHQHLNHNIHQWPDFNQQEGHQNPSWVDEFMEFSTAKRVAHRRTVSDPSLITIETEAAGLQQPNVDHEQFDKLDDEQLMSMFSSNELGWGSNPSSTSDHNSTNECQKGVATRVEDKQERDGEVKQREEKEKTEEVESTCKGNGENQQQDGKSGNGITKGGGVGATVVGAGDNVGGGDGCGDQQPVVDPKRIKRILANRQSAQRSRVRKLQYISELERSVTSLQSEVSVLSPRVAFLDHQRMILNVDNSALKAKIAALAQDKIFKDAQQDALKREIERLRQVYYQQSLKKTEGNITPPPSSSPLPSPAFQPPQSDQIKDNESEQFIT